MSKGMSSFAAVFFFPPKLLTSFKPSSTPPDAAFVVVVAAAIAVTFSAAFRPPSLERESGFSPFSFSFLPPSDFPLTTASEEGSLSPFS